MYLVLVLDVKNIAWFVCIWISIHKSDRLVKRVGSIFNFFSAKSVMTPKFYLIVMIITYCFMPLKSFAEI